MPESWEGLYQFVELEGFRKKLEKIAQPGLFDLIVEILRINPNVGVLLKGGIRKVRVKAPQRKEGKSGGYRVFYYFVDRKGVFYLLWILDKRESDNLSPAEKKLLEILVRELSG